VRLDRCLGEEQPFRDLGVGEAADELDQDLAFSCGELVELGVRGAACLLRVGELMARTNSDGRASFRMKPLAPIRSAPKAYSSRSKVVRIRMRERGSVAMIARVASMPSTPGIRTSITTTSGWQRPASSVQPGCRTLR
jgi:hypothetical protein